MKNLVLILTLILVLGCNDTDEPTLNSQLIGKWKWVESSGGIAGIIETPHSTKKEISIEFTLNTKNTFINGVLKNQTTYYIERGTSILSTEKVDLINYEKDCKQSLEINEDSLILFDEVYDGFTHQYIRE